MKSFEKPIIIFDTDMDTDCDDVGALAMLLTSYASKRIELIGIVADSVSKHAAPFCETMTKYYGLTVPIGAIHDGDYKDTELNASRFERYRRVSESCLKQNGYNRALSKEIKKTDSDYPSAVKLYRSLLSKAEDQSVTVLCVGMLTAVSEALASPPDEISSLTGVELFRQKAKCVITMGDAEPSKDFNWSMDAYGAQVFFELCPVPVLISPDGEKIVTGGHLSSKLEENHPLRRAYEIWLGRKDTGRSSWDLVATLYAIAPHCPYFTQIDFGKCRYSFDERRLQVGEAENSSFKLLKTNCDDGIMQKLLNECMLGSLTL